VTFVNGGRVPGAFVFIEHASKVQRELMFLSSAATEFYFKQDEVQEGFTLYEANIFT